MNTKMIFKTLSHWFKKNSTKILASTAIAAEAVGFYFMHREAPIVRDKLAQLDEKTDGNATWKDKIKTAAPVYLPALGMLVLSSGCIVGTCVAGERKAALLSGLYTASEAALSKYEKKVVEVLGKDKAQEIHDEMARDLMNEKPCGQMNVYATGKGDQLFYEPLSGRYFTSEKLEVEATLNRCNRTIIGDMWISANEWFEELGLEPVGLGEMFGWNVDHLMDIYFSTAETPDNRTCFVIGYSNTPVLYK